MQLCSSCCMLCCSGSMSFAGNVALKNIFAATISINSASSPPPPPSACDTIHQACGHVRGFIPRFSSRYVTLLRVRHVGHRPRRPPREAYVSIRQHTSAYVSIRQHTSAYVSIRQHTLAYVSIRQHTSAYVSIRQHTSAYVSIRQHTSARRAAPRCTNPHGV